MSKNIKKKLGFWLYTVFFTFTIAWFSGHYIVSLVKDTKHIVAQPYINYNVSDIEKTRVTLLVAEYAFDSGLSGKDFISLMKIVRCESRYDTHAINPDNKNGTTDWGLFQINDIWDKEFPRLGYKQYDFRNNEDENIEGAIVIYKEKGIYEWASMNRRSTCK